MPGKNITRQQIKKNIFFVTKFKNNHMNTSIINNTKERAKKWLSDAFDKETRDRVTFLLEQDQDELIDAFYRDLEFGTGGLRGVMGVGTNRMNIYTVGMATQGLCNYLKKTFNNNDSIKAVIGHDNRNNSRLFAEKTAQIFSANGIKVYLFDDLRPTPEISFAIRHLKCQCGINITASHNPKEYNGYKVFWDDGGQIIAPHDINIIHEVQKIKDIEQVNFNDTQNLTEIIGPEIDNLYKKSILSLSLTSKAFNSNSNIKIVYTPLNGTGMKLIPDILRDFGFNNVYTVPEQEMPDGNFSSVDSPNPEDPAAFKLAIKKANEVDADLIMATDPDGDRVGIAVKQQQGNYVLLNGNQTGALLMEYILSKYGEKKLYKGNDYIIKTIVTSELIAEIADYYQIPCYDVLTGYKFIADLIKKHEGEKHFIAGCEESYGYLVGDFVRDKDAVSACALLAELTADVISKGKTVYEHLMDIYVKYNLYKESLVSMYKEGIKGEEEINKMMENFRNNPPEKINGVEVMTIHDMLKQQSFDMLSQMRYDINLPKSNVLQYVLKDGTKISLRPSGTEPKIKFYFSVNTTMKNRDEYIEKDEFLGERIEHIKNELGI